MISEQRARAYRRIRRMGYPARTAAWLTSAPRYDVPGVNRAAMPQWVTALEAIADDDEDETEAA